MDPLRNPYTPNAGAQPPAVVGRDDQLETFELLLHRMQAGRTEQSMIITGLRGVGKTVLLGRFLRKAQAQNWVVVDEEVSKHDETDFRRHIAAWMRTALFELSPRSRWGDRLQRAAGVLKSFSLSVDPAGTLSAGIDVDAHVGLADAGDLSRDLTDLFVAVGEAAQSADRGVVYSSTRFNSSVSRSSRLSLRLSTKRFAERLFKFPTIGNLDERDGRRALAEPALAEGARFTDEALDRALHITGGYPYFLQELGYAVWGIAEGTDITADDVDAAVPIYTSKLDSSFFRVRLDRATEMQRVYLRAMADLGRLLKRLQMSRRRWDALLHRWRRRVQNSSLWDSSTRLNMGTRPSPCRTSTPS